MIIFRCKQALTGLVLLSLTACDPLFQDAKADSPIINVIRKNVLNQKLSQILTVELEKLNTEDGKLRSELLGAGFKIWMKVEDCERLYFHTPQHWTDSEKDVRYVHVAVELCGSKPPKVKVGRAGQPQF